MMSVIFEGELDSESSTSFFGTANSRPVEMSVEMIERNTVDSLYLNY
jgi:hypothetical protein